MTLSVTIAVAIALGLTAALALARRERQSGRQRCMGKKSPIRAVGDNLPNGWIAQVVQRADGQISFTYISAGVERLTGYSPAQLHERPTLLYTAIEADDRWLLKDAAAAAARELSPLDVEVRLTTATGATRWVQICATPRRLPMGAVGWDGIQLDITARKAAEAALRSNESAYRALALEHSRLYGEARRQAEELATLARAGAAVAATLDINEAIGRILEQLALVVAHDSASVQLRQGDDSEVIGCRGFPAPELIIGLRFPIHDNALCQQVYTQGRARILDDTSGAEGFVQVPGGQIRSWLGLPLVAGEQVIGMLALDSATPGHFTAAHARLGLAFATQVAVALTHAQSYRRAVRAHERLLALQQANREIAAHRSTPGELYAAVHHATSQLMPADAFVIILFDLSGEEARDVYLACGGVVYPGEAYPRAGSFADYVVERGQPLVVADFASFTDFALDSFGDEDATRSGLAVALRGRARTLGIIFTQSERPGAYNEEDAALLELLAAHAATALENGALFAEVERLATTDPLTGLANRRHFFVQARLAATWAQRSGQPIAVALLDLDHFKQVNDSFGHQAGDQVLQVVAQTCRECVRAGDVVGRYGGEELAVLMPNTDVAGAARVAERIRKAIAHLRVRVGDAEIRVTASLGVAADYDARAIETTLACADEALYAAKGAGRNRVVIGVERQA